MFNWLVSAQYLAGNPFVLMSFKGSKDRSSARVKLPPKRFFEEDLWKWLTNFLEQLPSLEWILDEKGKRIPLPDDERANDTVTFWTAEKWPTARARNDCALSSISFMDRLRAGRSWPKG